MAPRSSIKLKIQILCNEEIAMGPGKADLLDAIRAHGSISAAARTIGMSYRRAWLLVDAMNRCWQEPIVETVPGSSHGGGARLTGFGAKILRHYRALQDNLVLASDGKDSQALADALLPAPRGNRSH